MIYCPNCLNDTMEILACDSCKDLGCARCTLKLNKQWLCNNCKSGAVKQADDMFSMFG